MIRVDHTMSEGAFLAVKHHAEEVRDSALVAYYVDRLLMTFSGERVYSQHNIKDAFNAITRVIADETRQLPDLDEKQLLRVHQIAANLAEAAIVGYWARDEVTREYMTRRFVEAMNKILDVFNQPKPVDETMTLLEGTE